MRYFRKIIKKAFDQSVVYDLFTILVSSGEYQKFKSDHFTKLNLNPVLDFGCGTGVLAKFFDSKSYLGLDPLEGCIQKAQKRHPGHQFLLGGNEQLVQFRENSFEGCISWGVLHHLNEEQLTSTLINIRRILKAQGLFIALEPVILQKPGFDIRNFVMKFDRGAYLRTTEEYLTLFKTIGFCEMKVEVRTNLVRIPYRHVFLMFQKSI